MRRDDKRRREVTLPAPSAAEQSLFVLTLRRLTAKFWVALPTRWRVRRDIPENSGRHTTDDSMHLAKLFIAWKSKKYKRIVQG